MKTSIDNDEPKFNNIPKVSKETISRIEELITSKVKDRTLSSWAKSMLEDCKNNNPLLFEYLTDSSNKFTQGVATSLSLNEISASKLFSDLSLLFIIDAEITKRVEWENKTGKLLKDVDFNE